MRVVEGKSLGLMDRADLHILLRQTNISVLLGFGIFMKIINLFVEKIFIKYHVRLAFN